MGKGGAGNGHLKLQFETFSCQALHAIGPLLSENPVIPHGSGWAWAAAGQGAGHDVGLHPPFKYLLYCVKTKYIWDWEMHLGSLSGAGSVCGCRRGAAVGVQGVYPGWGPRSLVSVPYPTCAPGASSHGCAFLALVAAGFRL